MSCSTNLLQEGWANKGYQEGIKESVHAVWRCSGGM